MTTYPVPADQSDFAEIRRLQEYRVVVRRADPAVCTINKGEYVLVGSRNRV